MSGFIRGGVEARIEAGGNPRAQVIRLSEELATPANTLRLAGQRLNADVGGGHFVACALELVEPPGYRLPLGVEDDGDKEDAKVALRAGDVVIFSSDGLVLRVPG